MNPWATPAMMDSWATAIIKEATVTLYVSRSLMWVSFWFFFFKWNQVNLFDFKFVQKAEILIANFNGKKNNFPVPRNIAFCVNSVQTLCLKIH